MSEAAATESFDEHKASYLAERTGVSLLLLFVVWSLLVVYSYRWNDDNLRSEKVALATSEARSLWNKDQAFRQWATRHGGLYVQPDERTPPNPALQHIENRDVVTTDGMQLTLMNPAYMMRQMTQEFEQDYGIKGKITGLRYLNEANRPDAWERTILERYAGGDAGEVIEETRINGEPYLRLMKPMFMKRGCLKCHAILGYREGDLRGGVSVSIPLLPYFAAADRSSRSVRTTHVMVWLFGSIGLAVFAWHAFAKRRERNRLLGRLEHNALYDGLTGLPTRTLVEDRINKATATTSRYPDHLFAVCFIDLDRFKHINDAFGHATGDALLRRVGQILTDSTRPADTVARLGGDEYVVLLDTIGDAEEALLITGRIREKLLTPLKVGEQEVRVGASIGIALSGSDRLSANDMIRNADIAMYRAKHGDTGGVEVFTDSMHAAVRDLTTLESDLQRALQNGELELYYQPIVDLGRQRTIGLEALLRWRHPQRGFVPPDQFIPIAEETGAIHEIGAWVMAESCRQLGEWQRRHEAPGQTLHLAVNLSPRQLLDENIVDILSDTLRINGIKPGHLHLEVTETAVIREQAQARDQLDALRGLGCRLSADDFGTGYSSLTYLQQYHFDSYKIDRQFVQDDSQNGAGMKLCNALIGLADDLGMQVVAEGVETHEQYLRLHGMGCRIMQGYYFARPAPAARIDAFLANGLHVDLARLAGRGAA